ncbi:MAG TPA: hypothetical protein VJK02_21570 [Anaerolineales bacterium]|nr:hypothetical protein [Anaerolineales bacterium]
MILPCQATASHEWSGHAAQIRRNPAYLRNATFARNPGLVMATGCDELRRLYDAARVRARKQPDETWKREPNLPQATCPRVAQHSQSPRSPQEIRLKSVMHRPFASREVFHGFLEESH